MIESPGGRTLKSRNIQNRLNIHPAVCLTMGPQPLPNRVRHAVRSSASCCNLLYPLLFLMGRDSSVGVATRYGLDGPRIESRWGARFSAPVQTGPGDHSVSCTMGTGSFYGLKQPGRGADHPPNLSAEVMKG